MKLLVVMCSEETLVLCRAGDEALAGDLQLSMKLW
jgi:hypothetical protein